MEKTFKTKMLSKAPLRPIKVDRRKLVTAKTYAKREKIALKTVYDWISKGKLNTDDIDGVTFIVLP